VIGKQYDTNMQAIASPHSRSIRIINQIIKCGYIILILIPVVYLIIATYSYYSVLNTFGEVPSSQDFTADLIRGREEEFRIFPPSYGEYIIGALLASLLLIPLYIAVNFISKLSVKGLMFQTWYAVGAVISFIFCWIVQHTEAAGWYFSYVLD